MRDTQKRERERERQRHRQRDKQAPCREPDMGLDPGSPGSHPGLKAALNHCATGAALEPTLKKKKNHFFSIAFMEVLEFAPISTVETWDHSRPYLCGSGRLQP